MKKTLLLFCANFLVAQVWAQDTAAMIYKSVLEEGMSSWNVCYLNSGGYETQKVDISRNDTITMEGVMYYQPRYYWARQHFYMRESEDHSRLYCRWEDRLDLPESMVMDLNLEVGDTVDTRSWLWANEWPPITVQRVYYENGLKCISTNWVSVSTYGDITDTLIFMEGIGPTVFFPFLAFHYRPYYASSGMNELMVVLCYDGDGDSEPEFVHFPTIGCELFGTIGVDQHEESGMAVFPNPVTDRVFISNMPTGTHRVEIINAQGSAVLSTEMESPTAELNLSGFARGVYMMKIDDNKIFKIIKL